MRTLFVASAAALMVAGCGGGGGGGGEAAPPATVDALQGYWEGPVTGSNLGGGGKVRAVVLSDGQAWLFQHETSTAAEPLVGITKATLSVSGGGFVGSGKRYPASGNALADVTVTNGDREGDVLLMSVNSASTPASTLTLARDGRYSIAAVAADVVGAWHFTKENGSIDATWNIAAGGGLTGSSSLGCSFSGQVVPRAATAVFDASVTETCTGSLKQLTGIARLNTAKTFLTFGLTTTDGTQAEAFPAARAAP